MPCKDGTGREASRTAEGIEAVKAQIRSNSNLIKPVMERHFGADVWTSPLMDNLCLCLNCENLDVNDPSKNCKTAQDIFGICVRDNIATAMTRCPNLQYKPKRIS